MHNCVGTESKVVRKEGVAETEKAEQNASGGAKFLKIIPNNTMLSKLARTATPTCSETRAHRTTSKKGDRLHH